MRVFIKKRLDKQVKVCYAICIKGVIRIMEEKIIKDIAIAKARLTAKARRIGLWENFGQKEVDKLKEKHIGLNYVTREIYALFQDFDNWCMNFDLNDLKGI